MSQPLSRDLRKTLEKTILSARELAEAAAEKRLRLMDVRSTTAPRHLAEPERLVRAGLRGLWQQLGGDDAAWRTLVEEVAYAQWHRLLFARFLLENDLLLHPDLGVSVTMAELKDLAQDANERDAWTLAARYASAMLPGIFRQDDPASRVLFAPEDRQALEALVADLAPMIFTTDDALGWVYQFWQTQRKTQINKSEVKIGAAEIAPVTQLFTEEYMVRFLLENSLGAWWVGRHPASPLLREFSYLRFGDDGRPAAGTFDGWPASVADVTVIDPCCGSGHFLVAAFEMLRQMRIEEEGLDVRAATDAVLRDNLFGLEIDARCVQIAAFALALAAWKVSGYHQLPTLNLACSGIAAGGTREEWQRLAADAGNDAQNLRIILGALYDTFKDAPTLGSLIDPASVANDYKLARVDYAKIEPLLTRALRQNTADPVAAVFGEAAEGMLRAARLLSGKYTLVATNVPYLSRTKQDLTLKKHCEKYYWTSKSDLATVFVKRCLILGQCIVIVTPSSWLSLSSYGKLREDLLKTQKFTMVVNLGPSAFHDMNWWAANTSLIMLERQHPLMTNTFVMLNVEHAGDPELKSSALSCIPLAYFSPGEQLRNPDSRIIFNISNQGKLLFEYANAYQGISTKDEKRFIVQFWELPTITDSWELGQSTAKSTFFYTGFEIAIRSGFNDFDYVVRGRSAWKKPGIAIGMMSKLPVSLYLGNVFDTNITSIIPIDSDNIPAIWAFCSSPDYYESIRKIDKSLKVTNATLVKVPFDLEHWQRTAEEMGPLPKPHSDDPTQWLFGGNPVGAEAPLHVALARLLGYRWPQQGDDDLGALAVDDGIFCLDALAGQPAGVERLRKLLVAVYGAQWSSGLEGELLAQTGGKRRDLAGWLRDEAAEQHNALFHQRPFLWHIWDGRPDGFSAIVNYHRLDAATLRKLTYTYLGAWIDRQRDDQRDGVTGAEPRLAAALELQATLVHKQER